MPPKEKHEIKMMYAVYADGRKEPIVIDEIKDLSLEEAEPILEEHNFVKVTRCKDCIHCEHWYADKGRCFLWHEGGIDVFEDGFCNYGERREE